MATVAMVTKVQKMLNSLQTSQIFCSIFFKFPLFCFHGNCGKVCPTDSDFMAYLVPLDVDVVPIKFHQFLFVP
jgi:hypothetical protein